MATNKPAGPTDSWYVYMVTCRDGSLYTGIARDLEARLAAHNAGIGGRYTRARLPVVLAYSEPAPDRSAASRREAAIKKLPRQAKMQLITTSGTNRAAASG
jgi:putative endonuclease